MQATVYLSESGRHGLRFESTYPLTSDNVLFNNPDTIIPKKPGKLDSSTEMQVNIYACFVAEEKGTARSRCYLQEYVPKQKASISDRKLFGKMSRPPTRVADTFPTKE